MADLSNPLTQVVVAQAQPAVTVNNLVDALSPAAIFGQNDLTTSGLTWGYYGGRYRGNAIAHGTIALPTSQASVYIVAAKASGVVSQATSTTNWNDSTNYDRLYLAVTGSSTITDWDDYREVVSSAGAGVATIDTEQIQDIIAALIAAGTNIVVTYNDGFSPPTLVIDSTGGGSWGSITGTLSAQSDLQNALDARVSTATFQEQVQDIIGALLTAGSNITLNYNDGDSPPTLVLSATSGGGSITGWTSSLETASPNNAQNVSRLLASGGTTDQDALIQPKAQGAILAQLPDNTATGGNKRGINAIDFQMSRTNADEVASGTNSFAAGAGNKVTGARAGAFSGLGNIVSASDAASLGGTTNTPSGNYSVSLGGTSCAPSGANSATMGHGSLADADHSFVGGHSGTARGIKRSFTWSAGQVFYPGSFQGRLIVLQGRTLDATPLVMTTDGQAAAANNQINGTGTGGCATKIRGQVVAHQSSTGDCASWDVSALLKNVAGTTTLVGAATVTAGPVDAGASTWTLGITVSDADDAFTFTVTGEAAHDICWTATIQTAEAGG